MMVRAKFTVDLIERTKSGESEMHTIKLSAVTRGGSAENAAFWKWTPNGQIMLQCVNPKASEQFELGKELYVDFSSVGNP